MLYGRSLPASFRITRMRNVSQEEVVNLADPFLSVQNADETDRRVAHLSRLLGTLHEPDSKHHALLMDTQLQWERIESVTQIHSL